MPLVYKFNVLDALKDRGYPTTRLRKEELLAESVIQHLRTKGSISWASLERLCALLQCQPGDLLEYTEDKAVPVIPDPPQKPIVRTKDDEFLYLYEIWCEKYREPDQPISEFNPSDFAHHLPIPDDWQPKQNI